MRTLVKKISDFFSNPNLFESEWHYGLCAGWGALSGVLLLLAFPTASQPYFAFIGYIPLCLVLFTQSFKRKIVATISFITVFYCYILSWMAIQFHPLTLPALIVALYVQHLIVITVLHFIAKKITTHYKEIPWLLFPLCFTLFEYLRTIGFIRFPYGVLGYSQWNFLPFIQFIDITGYLGISFVLYFINAFIANALIQSHRKKYQEKNWQLAPALTKVMVVILSIMLPLLLYGFWQLSRNHASPNKKIRTALIQPWFDFNLEWSLERKELLTQKLITLSDKAKVQNAELIIWPETSLQDYYYYYDRKGWYSTFSKRFYDYFHTNNINADKKSYFLVGSLDFYQRSNDTNNTHTNVNNQSNKNKSAKSQKTGKKNSVKEYYNIALFIEPNGEVKNSTAKKLLVAFAEWFPYADYFPFLAKILESAQASNFTPGKEYTVFTHPKGKFSVLICYEDCFSALPRKLVQKGAEFLVVITNDAWSYSAKSEIFHYIYSVLRAIENRRPVLRAANAGVTGIVSAKGENVGTLPLFKEDIFIGSFNANDKTTIYSRVGEKLMLTLLGVFALLIVLRRIFRRT